MEIKALKDEDSWRWDEFVYRNPSATLFHTTAWRRIIESVFNYRSFYYYAEQEGKIVGICPLFLVQSFLFGNSLISTPFATYGGILGDGPEARRRLLAKAEEVGRAAGAKYIELKSIDRTFQELPTKRLYVTFRQELYEDPERNFKLIPRKTRRMIRLSLSNGLSIERSDDLEQFYDIYAASLRRLGTPSFPKSLFERILAELPGQSAIFLVKQSGRAAAGVLTFFYRDTILPYYGGAYQQYNGYAVNNFMYWKLIEYGCNNGFKVFDFGRSKIGSGSYEFKKHWGMEERPLEYEYCLLKAREMPNFSPANPRFHIWINLWKRLPLSLTKLMGPHIVRHFP